VQTQVGFLKDNATFHDHQRLCEYYESAPISRSLSLTIRKQSEYCLAHELIGYKRQLHIKRAVVNDNLAQLPAVVVT